jgi:predicted ATPase
MDKIGEFALAFSFGIMGMYLISMASIIIDLRPNWNQIDKIQNTIHKITFIVLFILSIILIYKTL